MKQKLSPMGMKVLKIIHLLCAIVWTGSSLIMNYLLLFGNTSDPAGMFYVAEVLDDIDILILTPSAIISVMTGIAYGVWSNWGFFRHRWLTVKWTLTILIVLIGTFLMCPRIEENVAIARTYLANNGTGDVATYWQNVTFNTCSGLLLLVLLVFIVAISVLKPWRGKGTGR